MFKRNSILSRLLGFAVFLNLHTAWAGPSISDLSLEQKVGQLFLIGITETQVTPALERHLETVRPGGVILFKRNILSPYQSFKLNQSLRTTIVRSSNTAPFLAVDQEGGRVVRVATSPSIPSPLAIGKTGSANLAKAYGKEIGQVLQSLGFNMNLAPVLDVLNRKVSSFIGDRSFGFEAELVGKLGKAFSLGLISSGVIPTGKHFPGSGGMVDDPHLKITVDTHSTISRDSQKPFLYFSEVFPSAIMLSHASYPNLTKDQTPATFSKAIINDYLRTDLNFQGLSITDDLLMSGAKIYSSIGEAAVNAILAGNDLIMITWSKTSQQQAFFAVLSAVKSGRISKKILNDRVARIIKAKSAFSNLNPTTRYPANTEDIISSKPLSELDTLVMNINLENQLNQVPLSLVNRRILVLADNNFRHGFKSHFQNKVLEINNPKEYSSSSLGRLQGILERHPEPLLAVCTTKKCLNWLNQLPAKKRKSTVVVNLGGPSLIPESRFSSILNFYHDHADLGSLLAQKLSAYSKDPISVQ